MYQEKSGYMNIYYIGLTNSTMNVVWLNPKAPIPKFDNSSQYDIHIFIHKIGKHIIIMMELDVYPKL